MKLKIVLAILTLSTSLQAQEKVSEKVSNKLYGAYLTSSITNEALTIKNMSNRFRELNPLYPSNNKAAHVATFAGYQALSVLAMKRLEKNNPKIAKVLLWTLIGTQGFVTSWELHNLK